MHTNFFSKPLFEDGEVVEFGSDFINSVGEVDIVRSIIFEPNFYRINGDTGCSKYSIGEHVKRAGDTWERLEKDAMKEDHCSYFGNHAKCENCPAYRGEFVCITEDYGCIGNKLMKMDIVRRAKALAGVS